MLWLGRQRHDGVAWPSHNGVVRVVLILGLLSNFAVAQPRDTSPPLCTVVNTTLNTWTLQATENTTSEDLNRNGILDPGEDENGNGVLDAGTGLRNVTLLPGSTNVKLNGVNFTADASSVTFTVDRITARVAGSGTVVVYDGANNNVTTAISFPAILDTSAPLCTVVNKTQNTWTLQATDNMTSEDVNGNGILDAGEDKNANGFLEIGTGVFNVAFLTGSTNLRLNAANLTAGVASYTFTVDRVIAGQAGNGTLIVFDGANNSVTTTVSFASVSDTTPPVCTVVATTRNVLTLQASDNITSEDLNVNGQIDAGEDNNSNGVLDVGTGIVNATLQAGYKNMQLNLTNFTRGVTSFTFTVYRVTPRVAGSGTVIVTDGANNTVSTSVSFATITDTISPVCNVLVRGQNTWTILATDSATEDANQNGLLDPGEDRNNNGFLDIDTGVFNVTLQTGFTNMKVDTAPPVPGVPSYQFTVSRINAGQAAGGNVIVRDVAGNTCTAAVVFATPTRDPYDPVITIVSKGRNSWTLRANDDEPSEDVNGNGVLDGDEDANGNGYIDGDSGVANVTLQTGSSNVRLTVANFTTGVASVRFTVSRITGGQAGSGVVVVRDVAGNSKTQAVVFAATNDPYNPVCSVLRKGQNTWSLRATDNEPSEDENGNGVLDNQEDSNGNGDIDTDTGIASVLLQPGSTNVKLNVAPFVSGVGSIQFTVDRNITGVAGRGTVVVKDQEGNQCTLTVVYDPTNDPYPPVVTVLSKGQTTWTLLATDNRTSEDVNRNGQLDNNEDKNNNGVIDQDTGIASITLQSNTNLRLNVANFDLGVSTIQFTVDRISTLVDGTGTLVVRDVAGNTNRTSILIPVIDRTPGVTGDSFNPVCTVVSRGANTWVLRGTDNKPSEDVNGNNQLDTGEDTNANGIIDEDTGIASVVLVSGSTNVRLNVPTAFASGDPSVRVTVDRITAGQAGSGTVRITDGGGNLCTLAVTFGVPAGRIYNDAYNPVCTVLTKGRTRWSARATDKRRGEDLNRNGRIDADEDANDNGLIDGDSGIKSVVLKSGSSNVRLNVTPFTPGARTVNFTVERVSKRRSRGRGTVLVTDRAGHTCTVPVRLNRRSNGGSTRGKGRGFIRSTRKKDKGKVKRTLRGIVH